MNLLDRVVADAGPARRRAAVRCLGDRQRAAEPARRLARVAVAHRAVRLRADRDACRRSCRSSRCVGRWHWPASTIAVPAEPAPMPQAGSADNAGIPIAHAAPPASAIAQGHTFIQAPAATDVSGLLTIPSSSRWTRWLLVIWLGGALLALVRMLRGLLRLRRELAQAVADRVCAAAAPTLPRSPGARSPCAATVVPGRAAEPDRGRRPAHRAAALGARHARPRAIAGDAGA